MQIYRTTRSCTVHITGYDAGILLVLRSGIPWRMLPQELGCGSGMTCWRRLRDWQEQGIWDLMYFALLSWLSRAGEIDWSRALVDSCSIRAVCGGTQTGPNPTDRAKRGRKLNGGVRDGGQTVSSETGVTTRRPSDAAYERVHSAAVLRHYRVRAENR
jgi:transposase